MKRFAVPALFLLLVFSSCQSLDSVIREPKLSINSVDLTGINFNGADLVLRLDVENPNAFSIPLPKVDWQLFINTSSFLKGTLENDASIAGRGKTTVDIPLSVTFEELFTSFSSLVETKEAACDIALEVSFPIPFLESKVYNLDFSGVIPLPQLPKLSAGKMEISGIDFSGIEMVWNIAVENPNAFTIPFPELNWDYDVNGVSVLKSTFAGTGEIAAGAAAAALISVNVAYADIFNAVASVRNSGEARSSLSLDTGIPLSAFDGLRNTLSVPALIPVLRKPEISFQGITRKSIGSTMEFILNWEVENKNNFDFNIGEFVYDFRVNDSQWGRGSIENAPEVKAGGTTIIPLTVSISALSLVRDIAGIISRGLAVNYTCTGNMSLLSSFPGLDKLDIPVNLSGSTRIR